MPTTSNFGWTTPADTDLVKDGALAIRTLGNGIDTSMAELKGGTTGQILSKTSNTDMDFTWIANDQGDITNVSVTSPITGGGSSGSVTIAIDDATTTQKGAVQLTDSTSSSSTTTAATPNSVKSSYDLANAAIPKSLVDAAGDLIYATGDNTVARLAIGTAGQVLKVNSGATAPEWGTASSSPTFVGCYATNTFNSAAQSLNNTTYTVLNFNDELFDTDGFHSNSTNNSRITIPSGKGGKYLILGRVGFASNSTGPRGIRLLVNGTLISEVMTDNSGATYGCGIETHSIYNLNATDYIQVAAFQASGGSLNTQNGAEYYSALMVQYLGA